MASSKLRAESNSGDLPTDALFELCRLRAVCRSWQTLTSDPLFVAAHRGFHPDPLLAVDYLIRDHGHGVEIVDLSGNVLRRIPSSEIDIFCLNDSGDVRVLLPHGQDSVIMLRTRLDVVCFTRKCHPMGLWVVNPATGVSLALPDCHSDEVEAERTVNFGQVESYAFGHVSSTNQYKALRITCLRPDYRQLCEVITLDGDGTSIGMWRKMQDPPAVICSSNDMKCVAVDGVVYFVMDFNTSDLFEGVMAVEPGSIASFNLETEEWMGTLRVPFLLAAYSLLLKLLSLADLNGCLVTAPNIYNECMDLWFLSDFESSLWVKKYSLPVQYTGFSSVYPLLVLDDGRILLTHARGFIESYDPRTGTSANVFNMSGSGPRNVGIYTGSLLSLENPCN
uniref:F-box associated beta-propeller type 3 domain-containing protein n=1 Tax=Leersia perrieri TaxID=77586 RepID=A0A0D9WWJ9_9ORYZ